MIVIKDISDFSVTEIVCLSLATIRKCLIVISEK